MTPQVWFTIYLVVIGSVVVFPIGGLPACEQNKRWKALALAVILAGVFLLLHRR